MFNLFKKKESNFIVLTIVPGVQPVDREEKYGDPLNELLQQNNVGEVTGGGTMLSAPDENGSQTPEFSDVEIEMNSHNVDGLKTLIDAMRKLNFPENTQIQLWDSPKLMFPNVYIFQEYVSSLK